MCVFMLRNEWPVTFGPFIFVPRGLKNEVVVGVPTAWGASIRELDSRNLRTESNVCQGTSIIARSGMCGKFHGK